MNLPFTPIAYRSINLPGKSTTGKVYNVQYINLLKIVALVVLFSLLLVARHVRAQSPVGKQGAHSTGAGNIQVKDITGYAAVNFLEARFFSEVAAFRITPWASQGRSNLFVAKPAQAAAGNGQLAPALSPRPARWGSCRRCGPSIRG
ncbi:hypothetical protein [Hymenobacter sedentarius]|uniref:hypothetical protein n=1 Tax=Hymenobacter sedentarius TaxID=1411621 RepID=UPI0012FD4E05|nr:hypothetical protein [Hymenobacter sedentarius]